MKLRKRKTTREQKFNLKFLSVFSRFEPVRNLNRWLAGLATQFKFIKFSLRKKTSRSRMVGKLFRSYMGFIVFARLRGLDVFNSQSLHPRFIIFNYKRFIKINSENCLSIKYKTVLESTKVSKNLEKYPRI